GGVGVGRLVRWVVWALAGWFGGWWLAPGGQSRERVVAAGELVLDAARHPQQQVCGATVDLRAATGYVPVSAVGPCQRQRGTSGPTEAVGGLYQTGPDYLRRGL